MVHGRRGMPRVPVAVSLAGRVRMPSMQGSVGALAYGTWSFAMSVVRTPGFGHGRHDFRWNKDFSADLVQRDVVCYQSEGRSECVGTEACTWLGKLSNRLGVAA